MIEAALETLKKQIKQTLRERGQREWFFERTSEVPEVAGWNGTDPIFFVALNPSSAHLKPGFHFPSKADALFYRSLVANGYANAHLTDVIKATATNKKVKTILADDQQVKLHRKWFLEEARILTPRRIVAVGRKAEEMCRKWLPDVPCCYVPHYSYAQRFGKQSQFEKSMRSIPHITP